MSNQRALLGRAVVAVLIILTSLLSLPAEARVHRHDPWQTLPVPVDPDADPNGVNQATPQDVAIDGDSLIVIFGYAARYEAVLYRRGADDRWTRVGVLTTGVRQDTSPAQQPTVVMKNNIAIIVVDSQMQIWERVGSAYVRSQLDAPSPYGGFAISGRRILAGVRDCASGSDAVILEKNASNAWAVTGRIDGAAGQCDIDATVDLDLNYDYALIRTRSDVVRAYRRNGTALQWLASGTFNVPVPAGGMSGPVALQLATAVTPGSAVFRRSGSGTWSANGYVKPLNYAMGTGYAETVVYRDSTLITLERDDNPRGISDPEFYVYVESSPGVFEHVGVLGTSVGHGTIDVSHQWAVSATSDVWGVSYINVWRLRHPLVTPEAIANDFQQRDLTDFQLSGGTYAVAATSGSSNLYLRQSSSAGQTAAVLTDSDWPDYQRTLVDITPKAFGSGDTWVGAAVRYVDADNYYYVSLRHGNVLQLRARVDGVETVLDQSSFTATTGTTQRFGISVEGHELRATLGDAVLEATDDSLDQGRSALLTYRATAIFDNVYAAPTSGYGTLTRFFGDYQDFGRPFTYVGGAWGFDPEDGRLEQTSTTGTALAVNGVPMHDQVVTALVQLDQFAATSTAVAWYGVVARYVDARNYYYLSVRSSGQVQVRKIVNGATTVLAAGNFTAVPGSTHRLSLEVVDDQLHALVDDVLIAQATDGDLTEGIHGLGTYRAATTTSSLRVTQP